MGFGFGHLADWILHLEKRELVAGDDAWFVLFFVFNFGRVYIYRKRERESVCVCVRVRYI